METKKVYKTGDLFMWNQLISVAVDAEFDQQDATYQTRSFVVKDPAFVDAVLARAGQVLTAEEEQEILDNTEPTFKRTK